MVNLLFAIVLKEGNSLLWVAVLGLVVLMFVVNASLSVTTWVLLQRDAGFRDYLKAEFRSAGKVHLLTVLNPALMLLMGSKLMDTKVFHAPIPIQCIRRIVLSEVSPLCFSLAVTAIKAREFMTSRTLAPTVLASLLVLLLLTMCCL